MRARHSIGITILGIVGLGAIINCGLSLSSGVSGVDAAVLEPDAGTNVPADAGTNVAPDTSTADADPIENGDASVDPQDADPDEPADAAVVDAGANDAGTDETCDGYKQGGFLNPIAAPMPRASYNGRCYWISTEAIAMNNLNNAGPVCGALGGFPAVISVRGGGAAENAVIVGLRGMLAGTSDDPWLGLAYFAPSGKTNALRWLRNENRPDFNAYVTNAGEPNGGCARLTTSGQWLQSNCGYVDPSPPMRRVVCERIYLQ
jgi:hypothetical protein